MSTEWLKDYELPLYSKEKQIAISNTLNNVRSIIDKRKSELNDLDDLMKFRFIF